MARRNHPIAALIAAAVLLAPALATHAEPASPLPDTRAADAVDDAGARPRAQPRYLLEGPGGRAVTSEDFHGRFQLVTFGFTGCADVCPTTLLEMKQVLATLGARAARMQPLFVTVDPQRDSAVVLLAYTTAFDARIVGLRGSDALLQRAAAAFGVQYQKVQEPGAPAQAYTMDHTAAMFLVGPDGTLLERMPYGMPAAEIAQRVGRWMDAAER